MAVDLCARHPSGIASGAVHLARFRAPNESVKINDVKNDLLSQLDMWNVFRPS